MTAIIIDYALEYKLRRGKVPTPMLGNKPRAVVLDKKPPTDCGDVMLQVAEDIRGKDREC